MNNNYQNNAEYHFTYNVSPCVKWELEQKAYPITKWKMIFVQNFMVAT